MRKRISKQKDIKIDSEQKLNSKIKEIKNRYLPLQTRRLLLEKTQCLQKTLKFEKERIDKIIKGISIESIKFQQMQKNCCFEELLKKYYYFEHIKYLFTDLIHKNSLVSNITFMDFKLKNFIIMNNYSHQIRRVNSYKNKDETNITASRSSTKQGKYFKQMEIQVKKITKKSNNNRKIQINHNKSSSFTHLLIKNIQRMLKNYRDPRLHNNQQIEFKPILTSKDMQQIENIHTEPQRLHTSPEPYGFDSYGLQKFKDKNHQKFHQISQMSGIQKTNQRSKLISEKSQDTLRYQTQYDTQKIKIKKSKSKNNKISFKKSLNKIKSVSKEKSILVKAMQKQKK